MDTVIIAGCSVLDIKDYKNNYEGTGHTDSPGEEWLKTGPMRLLGYNYTAPLDTQGDDEDATKQIVDLWFGNGGMTNPVDAWMIANKNAKVGGLIKVHIGTNASAIDLTKSPWEYKYIYKTGFIPSYEICTVTYNAEENKWPDEIPIECQD